MITRIITTTNSTISNSLMGRKTHLLILEIAISLCIIQCNEIGFALGQSSFIGQEMGQVGSSYDTSHCLDTDSALDCSLYELIAEEQSILYRECDKLMKGEIENMDKVMSHNIIHFEPSPLPIKIPAICWLVQTITQLTGTTKPDLITWIYDPSSSPSQIKASKNVNSGPMYNPASIVTSTPIITTTTISNKQLTTTLAGDSSESQVKSPILSKNNLPSESISASQEVNEFSSMPNIEIKTTPQTQIAEPVAPLGADGKYHASQLSPVIIIPGLMGSRLEDKLNKTKTVHWWCTKNSDWQEGFWMSVENFLPFVLDCWIDNMRLEYDPATGFAKSPPGVEVRTGPFGKIETVMSMDSTFTTASSYMDAIIQKLVSMGYESDVNVLAAPYDFRLAPQQLAVEGEYFDKLTRLIESTQAGVGYGNAVTLLCHSMGCPHSLIYLRTKSAQWRSEKISKVIAVSAPWGGSAVATRQLIAGGAYKIPLVSDRKLRDLSRTMPSISYLLPIGQVFGDPARIPPEEWQRPLVKTPKRSYGVFDMGQLLLDTNLTHQYEWYRATTALLKPSEPLQDVRLICIHGTDVATPRTLVYKQDEDFPEGKHQVEMGDGDGTVNRESLSVCKQWASQMPDTIQNIEVFSTDHQGVLKEDVMFNLIEKEILFFVNSK